MQLSQFIDVEVNDVHINLTACSLVDDIDLLITVQSSVRGWEVGNEFSPPLDA